MKEHDIIRERRISEFNRALKFTQEIIETRTFLKNIRYTFNEIEKLGNNINELEILVSKILEYVFAQEDLCLKRNEIEQKYVKEYIYLMTSVEIYYDGLNPSRMFENKLDFIDCIYNNSEIINVEELIYYLTYYDWIPNDFNNYVKCTKAVKK